MNRGRYSRPALNAASQAKLETLLASFNAVISNLDTLTDSREKSLALTNLDQAYMWAERTLENAQVWADGVTGEPAGPTPPQPSV